MSDRPTLLVPDPAKRIVSPDEAKRIVDQNAKYGPGGKRVRPPGDMMQDTITREEAMTHVATAVAESVRLAMEEQDSALGDRLEQMEQVIFANVMRAIERHTWRYRVRMWARGWLTELGVIDPVQMVKPVDAVDVLDPNVHAAAVAVADPLHWRECPEGVTEDVIEWLETTNGVAVARKPSSGEWYVVANNTATLIRACRILGGENPEFEDGTTAALLDAEFLRRARSIIENGGEVPRRGWDG